MVTTAPGTPPRGRQPHRVAEFTLILLLILMARRKVQKINVVFVDIIYIRYYSGNLVPCHIA